MKQSLILFALMIVFKPVFPVVEYVFDYEYISEVLCVNKDKPELNCNGKCYLMQSLAEVAKEEAAQKKQDLLKKVDVPLLFIEATEKSLVTSAKVSEQHLIYPLPSFYTFQETSNVFHPPIV